MKAAHLFFLAHLAPCVFSAIIAVNAPAQNIANSPATLYTLIDGSQIVDDCPVCDRLPIVLPIRGTFEMMPASEDPLFRTFLVTNIQFTAQGNGFSYKVSGGGTYVFGGELALLQDLYLEVDIADSFSKMACQLTNGTRGITRPWPMLQVSVDQTNGTLTKQYHLDLNAAPFREIWLSSAKAFTATAWDPSSNTISGGDILSASGRLVKQNHQLSANLGIQPLVPDLGLKDFDILPGGEIVFSIEQAAFSETLGSLEPGDLLSQAGRVVVRNAELTAKFAPQPPLPRDMGLGAVQVMNNGEVFFSFGTGFFSENLGVGIQTGDLLSSKGMVVRTGKELLARFNPAEPDKDYGLTAVFLWRTNPASGVGEIWFGTRNGFTDKQGRTYAAGDLLSDQGYVVFRNRELLSAFAPPVGEDPGLDGLFVISDVVPVPEQPPIRVSTPMAVGPGGDLSVTWSGPGRVFQVEKATAAGGPYFPISPIIVDHSYTDTGALSTRAGYYRVRQW